MPLIVARHGERVDYVDTEAWLSSEKGKARPWDPPLTERGVEQSKRLGGRIVEELKKHGLPPVTAVYASPFTRTLQTAHHAVDAMGHKNLSIHPEVGLVEALVEDWFRSWAVPDADCQWGGPSKKETAALAHEELHPAALRGVAGYVDDIAELQKCTNKLAVAYASVCPMADRPVVWGQWESYDASKARAAAVARRLNEKHAGETVLLVTHGVPVSGVHESLTEQESGLVDYTGLRLYVEGGGGKFNVIADGWQHIAGL
ncbi:Protein UBASH3A-like protein [Diplonema papillatum]|nr:Protein UBASH3A-like protein [Diplonema papillatum]